MITNLFINEKLIIWMLAQIIMVIMYSPTLGWRKQLQHRQLRSSVLQKTKSVFKKITIHC